MKATNKIITGLTMLIVLIVILPGCKKEPSANNENEVITTLHVVATDSATGLVAGIFTFKDLDGDKPNAPVQFDTLKFATNKTYDVSLVILDETKNPVDSTSNEIDGEADDHLFFFESNPSSLVSIKIQDKDSKGLPLGLLSRWTTTAAGSGTTKITLRHQPGVKNGTYSPGDTDLEITFQTKVQ